MAGPRRATTCRDGTPHAADGSSMKHAIWNASACGRRPNLHPRRTPLPLRPRIGPAGRRGVPPDAPNCPDRWVGSHELRAFCRRAGLHFQGNSSILPARRSPTPQAVFRNPATSTTSIQTNSSPSSPALRAGRPFVLTVDVSLVMDTLRAISEAAQAEGMSVDAYVQRAVQRLGETLRDRQRR